MSEEQIQALINAVKSDTALQERIKAAPDLDAVVAIAKEAGFVVTKEELKMAQKEATVELSDEELEAVSGGTDFWTDWTNSTGLACCDPSDPGLGTYGM
jgi:predicted ribosomally synthesized peptide with nif11-like leader